MQTTRWAMFFTFFAIALAATLNMVTSTPADAGCHQRKAKARAHRVVRPPQPLPYYVAPPAVPEYVAPPAFEPSPCEDYYFNGQQQQQAIRYDYRYPGEPSRYPIPAALPPQVHASVAIWYSYRGPDHSLKVYGLNDFNPSATPDERMKLVQRNGVFLMLAPPQSFGKVDLSGQFAMQYRWIVICDTRTGMAWVGPRGLRYALIHGQAPCTISVGSAQTTCTAGT